MFKTAKVKADLSHDKIGDVVDTIIGAGTVVVGTMVVKGTIRIEGKIEGKIDSIGDVVIADSGIVEATISGRSVRVAGVVKGNIKAEDTLEIGPVGKVIGDVEVARLTIMDGAVFLGACKMKHLVEEEKGKK